MIIYLFIENRVRFGIRFQRPLCRIGSVAFKPSVESVCGLKA